jgi:hypothetical protein
MRLLLLAPLVTAAGAGATIEITKEQVGSPRTCTGSRSTWRDEVVNDDIVRFVDGVADDALEGAAALRFASHALHERLHLPASVDVAVTLWLVTQKTDTVGPHQAVTISNATDAHVLVPSPTCSSLEVRDHLPQTVVHELAGEYLQRLSHLDPAGWSFYSGPGWFVQGYEEWLALTLVPWAGVDVGEAAARAAERSAGTVLATDSGIAVGDDYRDGAALVGYLAHTHGEEFLRSLVASDAPSLDAALQANGVALPELVEGFLRWRKEH